MLRGGGGEGGRSLKGGEHEKLLENLGLRGLPYLPCQEHFVHYAIYLCGGVGVIELMVVVAVEWI